MWMQESRVAMVFSLSQSNGHPCLNALSYQSDINENGILDPEILEELEKNVVEDEITEEFEILKRMEDHDDDEEEIEIKTLLLLLLNFYISTLKNVWNGIFQ